MGMPFRGFLRRNKMDTNFEDAERLLEHWAQCGYPTNRLWDPLVIEAREILARGGLEW